MHHRLLATLALALAAAPAAAEELSDEALCARLTAAEASAALASERTSGPAPLGGCGYSRESAPLVRLFNSSHATRAEHLELMQALKAKCSDGADGAVLCSVAFDIENEEISAIWFTLADGIALEIEADGGMTAAQAEALAAATR